MTCRSWLVNPACWGLVALALGTASRASAQKVASSTPKPAAVVQPDSHASPPPPSVCDAPDGDAARAESWGNHFAIFEELPTGDLVKLGTDNQFVDAYSSIVIRRVTDKPVIRSANSSNYAEWLHPLGLDVDVVVLRTVGKQLCRVRVRTPGLQVTGGYDDADSGSRGCPRDYPYFTEPGDIAKDTQWRIPAGTFQHGDHAEIQLRGQFIGEEEFQKRAPEPIKITANGETKQFDAYYLAKRKICGQSWTANFTVIDFGSVAPQQQRPGDWHTIGGSMRADTRYPIYLDFPQRAAQAGSPSLASGVYRDTIAITATAVDKDGKTRELALRKDADRPTLDSPVDGETVVVKIARKYKAAAGPSEITARTYSFAAVAGGLHAAVSGEHRASFGTTPAFLTVFRHDGKDPVYGFAETFSYTATRRTLEPGFFDEFGFGVHVSVLARKSADDGDHPLALGIGAHVIFGNNSIQLGAGWDAVNEKVYALIGLSIPEFAKFLDK